MNDVIDRTLLRNLRTRLDIALREVEDEFGLHMTTGNARFTDTNATLKLEISMINDGGEIVSKKAEAFKLYASNYGLNPTDLGKSFRSNGKRFTIAGLNTRAHRYPIIAKGERGKGYKFTASRVKDCLVRTGN